MCNQGSSCCWWIIIAIIILFLLLYANGNDIYRFFIKQRLRLRLLTVAPLRGCNANVEGLPFGAAPLAYQPVKIYLRLSRSVSTFPRR